MNSLKFLQKVAASFGGNANKITVVGQSSGAHMIRALLAAPSASSLFQSAILQSDPMVRYIHYAIILHTLTRRNVGLRIHEPGRPEGTPDVLQRAD